MTRAVELAQVASLGVSEAFKNRIINGGMVLDQRNVGAGVTPVSGQYLVDRWIYGASQTNKVTSGQGSGGAPAGFPNYYAFTSSSAYSVLSGDFFAFSQFIEGFNVADLNWGTANARTVTLSFQVYSSLTGTFGGALRNSASTRSYPFTYTISSVNTWTTVSITIPGDTTGTWLVTNGIGLQVNFGLGVGSTFSGTAGSWSGNNFISATGATSVVGTNGATWYVTGVQLEVGSTATGFEYVNYQTLLAQCQRYFCKSFRQDIAPANGLAFINVTTFFPITTYNPNVGWGAISFPVTMRTAPSTITIYGTTVLPSAVIGDITYFNGSAWLATASYGAVTQTDSSIAWSINGTWVQNQQVMGFVAFTASAEL